MTARTRAIERKLEEWFAAQGVTISSRAPDGSERAPAIFTGEFVVVDRGYHAFNYTTLIIIADLATAIELGEIGIA